MKADPLTTPPPPPNATHDGFTSQQGFFTSEGYFIKHDWINQKTPHGYHLNDGRTFNY